MDQYQKYFVGLLKFHDYIIPKNKNMIDSVLKNIENFIK